MNFRKTIAALLCGAVALGTASCGSGESASPMASSFAGDPNKIQVVCQNFPAYDWVRELTKGREDKFEITYLLDKGTDMHSFQPTADDVLRISGCDLFVYVGGESDKWAEDAIAGASNKNMKAVSLLKTIGSAAKTEEVKEGMQAEEEHDHDHEEESGEHHDEHSEHSEAPEYDEHIWLSLKNAGTVCDLLASELSELDKEGKDTVSGNLSAYREKLNALDSQFKSLADGAKNKTLIFGDRFPFRYFTEDYGFDYYAAFVGCSAETEASFETITFLAAKADELGAKNIYKIESGDGRIAQAIIDSTKSKDAKIVTLDSIQSVNADRVKNGETYLSIMQKNYEVLKETVA